jgi:tetratricopeptide (TPR) repeat protein
VLRDHLYAEEPERLRTFSERAVPCFTGDDPAWQIEALYHHLLATPKEGADALERLWREWDARGQHEALQALGVALSELIGTNQLEPSARARSLVCFGWIGQGRLPLPKAEGIAREAIDLFRALIHKPGEADAHDQLGDTLQAQGRLSEALREYEAGKQLRLDLTQRDPSNAGWQRELSVSHNCVGGVLAAQGRLSEALQEYLADLAIAERLAAHDPSNAGWQRELSVSHNCVGGVLAAQGQLSEALREYEAGKQLRLDLTQRDPSNAGWQWDLSVSHNRVGGVLEAQGRLSEALQEYLADLAISERLVAHDPSNAQWQKDLNVTRALIDKLQIEINDH